VRLGEEQPPASGPGDAEASASAEADPPGRYAITEVIPGGAPAARCNPVALLSVALGAAIGSFFVRDWQVGLLLIVLLAALAPLAVDAVRPILLRLMPVGFAALTVGWSALVFSDRGPFAPTAWPVAAAEVLRICYLVVPGVLLVPSLSPSRLADALAQRARLPHRPVVAASAALLRVQHLLDTWRQLAELRTIRGLHPGRSLRRRVRHIASLTFALLSWSLRASQQMALSMDARGFATASRRTFALPSPWRRADWVALAVAVLLLAAPMPLTALVR
jgi:energy-coupling factor transport system ATP-binding protein